MKRFDLGDYTDRMAALALTGVVLLMWGCIIALVIDWFTWSTEATEVPADPAPVIQEVEPADTVVVEAEPAPSPVEVDQELKEQLAIGIYREGGGDMVCDQCRLRIGDVMLNRTEDDRFPDTLEKVLTQKRQYGTMHWDGIVWPERAANPNEAHAVERAYNTAEQLLQGEHSELYGQGYIFQSEFPDLGREAVECCGIYYAKG